MYVDGGQSLYAQLFEVPGEWSGNESVPHFVASPVQVFTIPLGT